MIDWPSVARTRQLVGDLVREYPQLADAIAAAIEGWTLWATHGTEQQQRLAEARLPGVCTDTITLLNRLYYQE